eukprot:GILJ01008851.1.p1 GENE.GILJ01008851.1~~GILJ01008851.1.p1  ORF type:complete len:162 (-),score=40.48 GILJ01008851.1:59-544(-)
MPAAKTVTKKVAPTEDVQMDDAAPVVADAPADAPVETDVNMAVEQVQEQAPTVEGGENAATKNKLKRRKKTQHLKTYIRSIGQFSNPDFTIDGDACSTVNSFAYDMCDMLLQSALKFMRHDKRQTLKAVDIRSALGSLPDGLAKHSMAMSREALKKFQESS